MNWWQSGESATNQLSMEDVRRCIEYFKSEKYLKMVEEKNRLRSEGHKAISEALSDGRITKDEWETLWYSIEMNGSLIVSPEMEKKLLAKGKSKT